jgi:hypothetical protein
LEAFQSILRKAVEHLHYQKTVYDFLKEPMRVPDVLQTQGMLLFLISNGYRTILNTQSFYAVSNKFILFCMVLSE